MAALAVQDLAFATVLDDELMADGPSYTALTLTRLADRLPRAELFFITGADAFAEIQTWYRYPEVLSLAHFVVVSRPGFRATAMPQRLPELKDRMAVGAPADRRGTPTIFLVDAPTPDVSSTRIRQLRRAKERISGLVPPAVEAHIVRHGLYAEDSAPMVTQS